MKVLWLVNIILPYAAKKLGLCAFAGGGWISSQLDALKKYGDGDLRITILSVCNYVKDIERVDDGKFKYIVLPPSAANEKFFTSVLRHENPDIVHIYGTEFAHASEMLKVSDPSKTVVSIQGLVGEYSKCSLVGLPKNLVRFSMPKKIIYKYFGIPSALETKRNLEERSICETAALQKAQHIIGRTHWDKRCCLAINPALNYHFCNEILRDEFYMGDTWAIENCKRHSIFISQASYAIKGLHLFLPIFAEVIKKHPDSKLYIAGDKHKCHSNKIKQLVGDYVYDYGAYLNHLIDTYGLQEHITFLGALSASQMKEQYLSANLFLSCSTIENSPNSVGEAMILGMPIVASDVGGVSSIFTDGKDGITYPLGNSGKMLEAILAIFENDEAAKEYGANALLHAKKIYDAQVNTITMLNIYETLLEKGDATNE